jgi:CTP synthase
MNTIRVGNLTLGGKNAPSFAISGTTSRDLPRFITCQFHPEFLSRPNKSHPLFRGFIAAALKLGTDRQ